MKLIVSDTSPIRAIEWIGLLHVLESLYGKVVVPPAVAAELMRSDDRFRAIDVSHYPFFEVIRPASLKVVERFRIELDWGESEALAIALERGPCTLVMDEKAGRRKAQDLGIEVIGTIGILLKAREEGLITAVRPLVERLRNELNFFLSEQFVAEILDKAGEAPL